MLIFEQFKHQVEYSGLRARDCGSDHWQVLGGIKPVNFYPRTKQGPCIYVSGSHKGIHGKHATIESAIRMAREGIIQPFDQTEEHIDQPRWAGEHRIATTIGAAP